MDCKKFIVLILATFISSIVIAGSTEQTNNVWEVIHLEGTTQSKTPENVTAGADWQSVSLGENLVGPIYLRTGRDSRTVLKHRNDKITIASNSLLILEAEAYDDNGILTKIIQSIGYVLFDIEKNTGRTNIVETPYLVSVVKGTTFTVQASKNRSIVNLIEGRLQINTTHGNSSTIINSGQIAQLAKGDHSISVIDVAAQANPQNTINSKSVTGDAKPSDNKPSSDKMDIANSANDISNSTPVSNNISTNTVPASINSAVTNGVISAGKSGKIIYPGNNKNPYGNNRNNGNNGIGNVK